MIEITDINIHREEIVELWNICFGDEADYISFFIDNCPQKICLADREDGKIVSMLFMLDSAVNDFSCKYIYAACTLPEYRGRGIMGNLIKYSIEYCRNNKIDSVFLVPGESSLYEYYKKFGFIDCFERMELIIKCKAINNLCENCNIDFCDNLNSAAEIRNNLLKKIDSFRFTPEITEYIIKETQLNSGECLVSNDGKSVLFCKFTDEILTLREFLSDNGMNCEILSAVSEKYSAENIYIRCPIVYNNKDNECKYAKCGMLYPINTKLREHVDIGTVFYAGMYLD